MRHLGANIRMISTAEIKISVVVDEKYLELGVRTLHDGVLTAGRHQIVWNGQDDRGRQAASGVYFARVRTADGQTDSRRMMMVK